jgi:hypothetical protein
MLEQWLFPRFEEDMEDFVFQKNGAPPHWECNVRSVFNERLPDGWIGRCTEFDIALLRWPPRSLDHTEAITFSWAI